MAVLLLIILGIAIYLVLGKSEHPQAAPKRGAAKKEDEDEALLFTDLSDPDDSFMP